MKTKHEKQISSISRFTLVVFLFLTACRTSSGNTITFMVSGDPAEFNAYQELVTAFNDSQEDVLVELSHIPAPREYRTRLATEFAAGSPPDISLMNYRRVAAFAANGMLEPLGPFLNQSDIIQVNDFYAVAIDAFQWEGQLLCLPQNISSLVVYYNQDLFDAANVPYPPDKWTWNEFVDTAVALTQDTDNNGQIDQYGLGVEPSLYRLSPFLWQNNAPLVDNQIEPRRLTLTRPPSLTALQWFVDLSVVHHVVPDRVNEAAQDSESRFLAGTLAMYLNSRRGTPTYREISGFTWDVAPLPMKETSASVLHSDAYCLSAATTNKEAAWKFIEFANSFEGQTIIAKSGRTVPSLTAVAQSDAFLDPAQPPSRSRVFIDAAPILNAVPVISTWQEIEGVASEEIERAFYGDISAKEAAVLSLQRTGEYFLLGKTAK